MSKREGGTDYKPTIWQFRSVWATSKAKNKVPLFKIKKTGYYSVMSLFEIDCLNLRMRELASYAYTEPYANGSSTSVIMFTNGLYQPVPPTAFQREYFKSVPDGFCPKR